MKSPKIIIACTLLVLIATYIFFRPFVYVTVEQELVSPEDQHLWMLVTDGASVQAISDEIDKLGKDINDYAWIDGSLLSRAVKLNRYDLATWLLSQGADPNGSGFSPTPLWVAVSITEDEQMIRLLLDSGADITNGSPDDLSTLEIAEMSGNQKIISIIHDHIEANNSEQEE